VSGTTTVDALVLLVEVALDAATGALCGGDQLHAEADLLDAAEIDRHRDVEVQGGGARQDDDPLEGHEGDALAPV